MFNFNELSILHKIFTREIYVNETEYFMSNES